MKKSPVLPWLAHALRPAGIGALPRGVETAVFNGFDQCVGVGFGRVERNRGVFVFEADFGFADAVDTFQNAGYAFDATAAGHAADV